MTRYLKFAAGIGLMLCAFTTQAQAYYFGKNKVQHRQYKWQILQSEHFDIYYYPGEERLAQFAIPVLEEAYQEYCDVFPKQPAGPVPVVIYSSARDFQATNITLSLIEEGVGGFTEVFKKRVVVPFTGSYAQFRHVLRHELVHVFQYTMLERFAGFNAAYQVPLWVIEGSAEYLSEGWSESAESFMRDAVINDYCVPLDELASYSGYIVYKEGQAIFRFLETKYGKASISEIMDRLAGNPSFDKAASQVLNQEPEQLAKQFSYYNKKQYYGYVADYEFPTDRFKRLTDHTKQGGWMNVGPALSPDGKRLAIISDRTGFTDIYLISLSDGKVIKRLVSGQRKPDLENLHLLRPGMCFSPDGSKLAFISGGQGADILNIIDATTGKRLESIRLTQVEAGYTPAWSPDGDLIVFVGVKNGESDLYTYRFSNKGFSRLSYDPAEERDPAFSRDGKTIIYASDLRQGQQFSYGSYAIYTLDLETGQKTRISPYFGFVGWPRFYQDGVVFAGEYQGVYNLMLWRNDSLFLLSKMLTSVKYPSWSKDMNRLVISSLWEGGYDVFVRTGPLQPLMELPVLETDPMSVDTALYAKAPKRDYGLNMSMDWIMGGMSYSSAYGAYGTVTMGFSDVLGNLRLNLLTDAYSQNIEDANFDLGAMWLAWRTDLGADVFQWWNLYVWPGQGGDTVVYEKELGAQAMVQYPFNRFQRVEFGIGYSYLSWYRFFYPNGGGYQVLRPQWYNQYTGSVGLVHDDVLYSYVAGPLAGQRWYLGMWSSLPGSGVDTRTGLLDFRKYWHITPRSVWAWRFQLGRSFGSTPLPFWLGGATTLRGYWDYFFTGQNMLLFNSEVRIPFLDRLKLGFIPVEIGGLRGVAFYDMGNAWFDYENFTPFERVPDSYLYRLKSLYADVGFGFRMYLGYFTVKTDFARRTDLNKLLSKQDDGLPDWMFHLSFGTDF